MMSGIPFFRVRLVPYHVDLFVFRSDREQPCLDIRRARIINIRAKSEEGTFVRQDSSGKSASVVFNGKQVRRSKRTHLFSLRSLKSATNSCDRPHNCTHHPILARTAWKIIPFLFIAALFILPFPSLYALLFIFFSILHLFDGTRRWVGVFVVSLQFFVVHQDLPERQRCAIASACPFRWPTSDCRLKNKDRRR